MFKKNIKVQHSPLFSKTMNTISIIDLKRYSHLSVASGEDISTFLPKPRYFTTNIFGILEMFSKFLYLLGIFPYKIQQVPSGGYAGSSLELTTCRFRQGMSLIIHMTCHLVLILRIRVELMRGPSIERDPVKLFRIMTLVAYFMANVNFTKICLSPTAGFKSLLTLSKSVSGNSTKSTTTIKNRLIGLVLCGACFVIAFENAAGLLGLAPGQGLPTTSSVCKAAFTHLHLGSLIGQGQADICTGHGVPFQLFVTLVYSFGIFSITFIGNCSDTFVVFVSFAVYILGKDFSKFMKPRGNNSSPRDLEKILVIYGEVKCLMEEINEICGTQVFTYTLAAIPYYGTNFVLVFDSTDWLERYETLYNVLYYLTSLCIAAEAHLQIQTVRDYVSKYSQEWELEEVEIYLVMCEISESTVGLKGNRLFTITYSLLGNVVGSLMTYIIIMLQFGAQVGNQPGDTTCDPPG